MIKENLNNYAFIDSQNLNLGVKSQGWKLDWRKFRQYLINITSKKHIFLLTNLLATSHSIHTYKNVVIFSSLEQKKTKISGRSKP